jgi:hypothetical protein
MRPADREELARHLREEVQTVLPGSAIAIEPAHEMAALVHYVDALPDGRIGIVARSGDDVVAALSCQPQHPLTPGSLAFLRHLVRLFSRDVRVVADLRQDQEVWFSLCATRFARTVARASAFSTTPFIAWLACLEAASSQTYEQQPFSGSAIFTKQLRWVADAAGGAFVRFADPMSFESALLHEKWTRPLLASGELALVGVGRSGAVHGLVAYGHGGELGAIAPHHELAGLYRYLVRGTTLFLSSGQGDIFVSLPEGPTFAKSQGRWHYRDYDAFMRVVSAHLPADLGANVLQLALDLSFERIGSLLVFLSDGASMSDLIPDHETPDRVSQPLRQNVAGLRLMQVHGRQVIAAAARADGAIVFDRGGRVLDAACMVAEPSDSLRRARGVDSLMRFPGARTTAAWNASFSGLAIKVSEDGPLEIYRDGACILRMG